MLIQCSKLKGKNFKPGFDRMTADAAKIWFQVNTKRLIKDISDRRFAPMPAAGFTSAKLSGGYRRLNKLTAIDSAIQLCLLPALAEMSEAFFSPSSFAYRTGRGLGAALLQYCAYAEEYAYAAKIDLQGCYDHIQHDILQKEISEYLQLDDDFEWLLTQYMKMPVWIEQRMETRTDGLLQGAPLSPLLCNLYFHPFDLFMEAKDTAFIRYADDIVLFANTAEAAHSLLSQAADYIQKELKLSVNQKKSAVRASVDMKYLGHSFVRDRHGMIALKTDDSAEGAYYAWYQQKTRNTHRTIDVLSEGVLRQKDYSLFFDTAFQDSSIPLMTIDRINIYSSVVFDSGFLQKALENQIYINLFDKHGVLLGRFLPNIPLKNPPVTHEQLQAYFDPMKRLYLAKQFVLASIHNLRLVIRYYQKQNRQTVYELALAAIHDKYVKIKQCQDYEKLLLLEASARKEYYDCFDFFIHSQELAFDKRTRRPPQSEINAMLSFGNTVLYNIFAFKINKSPLDIRIGFLHAASSARRESLNLDMAEIFKPLLVDRVIFSLCNLKAIQPRHFSHEENGAVYLSEEGKRLFLKAFYDKLEEGQTIHSRFFSYNMLMDEEVRKLVRHFKEKESYKAYRQVR